MQEMISLNSPTPVEEGFKKKSLRSLLNFPIMLLFFLLLAGLTVADLLAPDKAMSELENKPLNQAPSFNIKDFLENKWTLQYTEYVRDQFIFRDNWISLHSMLESAQGKLENGGVWYGKDDYLIATNKPVAASGRETSLPDNLAPGLSSLQLGMLPNNINAIAALAADYDGPVNVLIVPSPANTLSGKLRFSPPQYDENAMLDYMYDAFSAGGANVLDLRPIFAEHADENLFYLTDHHWTTTGGAWLAYEAFAQSHNIDAVVPAAPLVSVEGFFGTNFAKSKKAFAKADVLEYYDIPNLLTVHAIQPDGSTKITTGAVMDYEKLDVYDKYAAFLHGNNGYSELEGDGEGSILVIKDSYANSFVPYLAANYAKIAIVDPRVETSVNDIISCGEWDEILVLYGFNTFSTETSIYRIRVD